MFGQRVQHESDGHLARTQRDPDEIPEDLDAGNMNDLRTTKSGKGTGHGGECLSDDQMMENLSQECQNCAKNGLMFELSTHMIDINEIHTR